MTPTVRRPARLAPSHWLAGITLSALFLASASFVCAQGNKPGPDEMRWGLHVTLVSRWLDPAETEAFSTPFMVMYAIHDAMLRPMPAGLTTPSLAESWSEAKDHLSYTFTLRKGVKFHNNDPITAEEEAARDHHGDHRRVRERRHAPRALRD